MEWMLQVVDEMDDALGVLRHRWFGLAAALSSAGTAFVFRGQRRRAALSAR